MNAPRRIACFHLNQVGDLLFALPAIYNLRLHFPEAQIISVARPHLIGLLRLSGVVDEIIERPSRTIPANLRIIAALREKKLDLAMVFSTSFGMSLLARLSGAPIRVGFDHGIAGRFVTHRVARTSPPSLRSNLGLAEAVGCPIVKTDYAGLIRPGPEEMDAAETVLRSIGIGAGEPFAVLSPGASGRREVKCWSDEGFAQVADGLAGNLGLRSVVVSANESSRIFSRTRNAVDLNGRTTLPMLAAVLGRAGVFVGVDSGVMHLASAMETPVVGLFGPTDPEKTGPQGGVSRVLCAELPCRPCLKSTCANDRKCMEDISPDAVLRAARGLIASPHDPLPQSRGIPPQPVELSS